MQKEGVGPTSGFFVHFSLYGFLFMIGIEFTTRTLKASSVFTHYQNRYPLHTIKNVLIAKKPPYREGKALFV
jgi:hypothetical protein